MEEQASERMKRKIERNLRLVKDPRAIVVLPRTREGRAVAPTIFPFDRIANAIRMRAGTELSFQEASRMLERISDFLKRSTEVVEELTGTSIEYVMGDEKEMLAGNPASHVLIPRTEEGKIWALIVKKMDSFILRMRTVSSDITKVAPVIQKFTEIMAEADEIMKDCSKVLGIEYDTPRKLSRIFSRANEEGLSQPAFSPS